MRQLVDLLNSITGGSARLSGAGAATSLARRGTASRAASASASPEGVLSAAPTAQRPMSAEQRAQHPALAAAEAALEAKLAGKGAACEADFLQLQFLNEGLVQQRAFKAAEACRDLNRCARGRGGGQVVALVVVGWGVGGEGLLREAAAWNGAQDATYTY